MPIIPADGETEAGTGFPGLKDGLGYVLLQVSLSYKLRLSLLREGGGGGKRRGGKKRIVALSCYASESSSLPLDGEEWQEAEQARTLWSGRVTVSCSMEEPGKLFVR